jgi:hypothetical protein
MGDHGDGYTTSYDAASGEIEWFHHGIPCDGPLSPRERQNERVAELERQVATLRSEARRLRRALNAIDTHRDGAPDDYAHEIARAALARSTGVGGEGGTDA